MEKPQRLPKQHHFRMMLCGHKVVETGAACLFLMVQGQLAQATASHYLVASETGILTVFPLVEITWTRHARHYTNQWLSALLVAICALFRLAPDFISCRPDFSDDWLLNK